VEEEEEEENEEEGVTAADEPRDRRPLDSEPNSGGRFNGLFDTETFGIRV